MPCSQQISTTRGTSGRCMKPYDALTARILTQAPARHPLALGDLGHLLGDDRQQNDFLVQHVVVTQVEDEAGGRVVDAGARKMAPSAASERVATRRPAGRTAPQSRVGSAS
jgi:hypothetical protein